MPWITPTADDVVAALSQTERTTYDTARGDDKLADVLSAAVAEVRGYVAAKYALGAEGTIPDRLKHTAIVIARHRFLTSLPARVLLTQERKDEYTEALKRLEAVAAGKFAIDTVAGAEQGGGSAEVVRYSDANLTREGLNGL